MSKNGQQEVWEHVKKYMRVAMKYRPRSDGMWAERFLKYVSYEWFCQALPSILNELRCQRSRELLTRSFGLCGSQSESIKEIAPTLQNYQRQGKRGGGRITIGLTVGVTRGLRASAVQSLGFCTLEHFQWVVEDQVRSLRERALRCLLDEYQAVLSREDWISLCSWDVAFGCDSHKAHDEEICLSLCDPDD